jgi:hypothetical protein
MAQEEDKQKDSGAWLRVFCPEARCITEEEISNLPDEKRRMAEAVGKKGVWLEVFCPDNACLIDQGKMAIPVVGIGKKEQKGFWLNLFCPEDRCVANEATDLP